MGTINNIKTVLVDIEKVLEALSKGKGTTALAVRSAAMMAKLTPHVRAVVLAYETYEAANYVWDLLEEYSYHPPDISDLERLKNRTESLQKTIELMKKNPRMYGEDDIEKQEKELETAAASYMGALANQLVAGDQTQPPDQIQNSDQANLPKELSLLKETMDQISEASQLWKENIEATFNFALETTENYRLKLEDMGNIMGSFKMVVDTSEAEAAIILLKDSIDSIPDVTTKTVEVKTVYSSDSNDVKNLSAAFNNYNGIVGDE